MHHIGHIALIVCAFIALELCSALIKRCVDHVWPTKQQARRDARRAKRSKP
jgi:hypothetical protein